MLYPYYFVPPGHARPADLSDDECFNFCASLKVADENWVEIPDSDLWISFDVCFDGAAVKIQKAGEVVFVNLFCLDTEQFGPVFKQLRSLYTEYELGSPEVPMLPNWIHSVPINQHLLLDSEITLSHRLTLGFYWVAWMSWTNSKRSPQKTP